MTTARVIFGFAVLWVVLVARHEGRARLRSQRVTADLTAPLDRSPEGDGQ